MAALLVTFILLVLALTAYAAWRGAPWLPTPMRAVDAALTVARVGPGDLLVDIGAGDGRVLRAAAARGAKAIGYELAPLVWWVGWLRTIRAPGVRYRFADGFAADLSGATVIFTFLVPRTMPRLAAALNRRPRTVGLRVISYAFALPDRPADEVVRIAGCAPIYLYRLPPAA